MRVVFMGTPAIAEVCLVALLERGVEVVGVYARRDKPVGRKQIITPPPVKVRALENGIPVFQPATLRALAAQGTAEHPAWLEVTVQDDDYLPDLAPRIEAMVQDLPLEVLRVKRQRGTATPGLWAEDAASLHELSPREVFARRLAQETLPAELEAALRARYDSLLATLHAGGAA